MQRRAEEEQCRGQMNQLPGELRVPGTIIIIIIIIMKEKSRQTRDNNE